MVRQQAISASNGSPYEGMKTTLTIRRENFPIRGGFRISRGFKNEARVVVAELERGASVGRGECVPYPRYGETAESVMRSSRAFRRDRAADLTASSAGPLPPGRRATRSTAPSGTSKRNGRERPPGELAGLAEPRPAATALHDFARRRRGDGEKAAGNADRPLLKIKLGPTAI